jgi:hypothetical protein
MSEGRFAWRRAARGLNWIGFGVFFFLSTQGFLHRGFWLDALSFWPVLLIAMGARMMFECSKVPFGVLLSPLLVVGTLSFVAWRGAEPFSMEWTRVEAARSQEADSWSLEATMALTHLDLRAGGVAPGMLLQGRTAPSDRGSVRVSERGDSSRVRLRSGRWRSGTVHVLPGKRDRWDLDVADDLPMTLYLGTAFAQGELELEPVEVRRVDLDGAFNDLTLRLGAPKQDTRIELEGAFNHLELVVPAGTPVRVTTDGFVNLVDRRSGNGRRTGPAYRVRSDGAFNRVVVRSE